MMDKRQCSGVEQKAKNIVDHKKARLTNDVRYQDRKEITLDCEGSEKEQQSRVISFLCAARGADFFMSFSGGPGCR